MHGYIGHTLLLWLLITATLVLAIARRTRRNPRSDLSNLNQSRLGFSDYKRTLNEQWRQTDLEPRFSNFSDFRTRTQHDVGNDGYAVYIIVSSNVRIRTKVGISNNPESRLKRLQTGHFENLRLRKIYWFKNKSDARIVERSIHRALKRSRRHVRGEWFDLSFKETQAVAESLINDMIQRGIIEYFSRQPTHSTEEADFLNHGWKSNNWKNGSYKFWNGVSVITSKPTTEDTWSVFIKPVGTYARRLHLTQATEIDARRAAYRAIKLTGQMKRVKN